MSMAGPDPHPMDRHLVQPFRGTVWCAGCGIGAVLYSAFFALEAAGIEPGEVRFVTGTGCIGRIPDYLDVPEKETVTEDVLQHVLDTSEKGKRTVLITTNNDFLTSAPGKLALLGGSGKDVTLIHINNLIYIISDDLIRPHTPYITGRDNPGFRVPFNVPMLARDSKASYAARWTSLKIGWLRNSLKEAFRTPGLGVVDVISVCAYYNVNGDHIRPPNDKLAMVEAWSKICNKCPVEELDLRDRGIVMGKFITAGDKAAGKPAGKGAAGGKGNQTGGRN